MRTTLLLAWLLMSATAQAQVLTVAVDSSLHAAMQVLASGFAAARPGVQVALLAGPSGGLLAQIASGAPVDLLASADAETAAQGVQRRLLLSGPRGVFAANSLVLVVPTASPLGLRRLSDLARPEVLRVAMGREGSEPSGRYAREAINAQRLWPVLQRKVVLADDVKAVLALVAAGDAEAGFAYATDAAAAGQSVRVVETLATTTPVRCVASVTANAPQPVLAQAFASHLRSDEARAVLQRFGFGPP